MLNKVKCHRIEQEATIRFSPSGTVWSLLIFFEKTNFLLFASSSLTALSLYQGFSRASCKLDNPSTRITQSCFYVFTLRQVLKKKKSYAGWPGTDQAGFNFEILLPQPPGQVELHPCTTRPSNRISVTQPNILHGLFRTAL